MVYYEDRSYLRAQAQPGPRLRVDLRPALAFDGTILLDSAKVGIMAGSILAGVVGALRAPRHSFCATPDACSVWPDPRRLVPALPRLAERATS